jgi:hypothetical protein
MAAVDFTSLASRALRPRDRPPEPWLNPAIYAAEKLTGGEVNVTTRLDLARALAGPARWDFMVVDIEGGWRWLASRLFIFSVLLKEVHDLQAVVIVESNTGLSKKLLGITTPDGVQSGLARRYPWFDAQLMQAANLTGVGAFRRRIPLPAALQTLEAFIDSIQNTVPPIGDPVEWSQIEPGRLWEHSPWLTMREVITELSPGFYDPRESTVRRAAVEDDFPLYADVMRRREPFVAAVNDRGEFLDLFNKQAIVNRLVNELNGAFGMAVHVAGDLIMGDKTSSQGDTFNISGQIGAVYAKATLSGVINNVASFGAASPEARDGIKQALEQLSALLETLPETQAAIARKIADNAKDVVEAGQTGDDKGFFEGCADTLRSWSEKVSSTVPAILSAANTLISAVGQVHGWF